MAAYRAFREPQLLSDPLAVLDGEFGSWEARKLRYRIYWSFYENNAYQDIHQWSRAYKTQYGLYRWIRHIYNPAYRTGEFWRSHLWGGLLEIDDRGATDDGALPIKTTNEKLRPAIAQLWQWSNWQIRKDITTQNGAILGDACLKIVDDTSRGKVFLEVVHPGTIKEVKLDEFGNVKNYIIERGEIDPDNKNKTVVYTETAFRDGDNIIFQTFKDNILYKWNKTASEWIEPYGFIPMVMIKHNDVGMDWGWGELHTLRSRIHEVDDLASKLSDQIRKSVEAGWLFSGGITKPTNTPTATYTDTYGTSTYAEKPQPGRAEIPVFYGPENGKATPLVAPLDIAATTEYIQQIITDIERERPELQLDIWNASGDSSGRALLVARQRSETKVNQRRPNYDDALVRAHQMAIAIGGYRDYADFGGFDLDSFARGDLDHQIGKRPVFSLDPLTDLELKEKRFTIGNFPTITRWRELGFDDDDKINKVLADAQKEDNFGLAEFTGVQQ